MRRVACALVLALSAPALPHRLDEYLQLTALSLSKGKVGAKMILTPGVAVARRIVALIDANRDGTISEKEKQTYAHRVLGDVSLTVDGVRLKPRLVSYRFPRTAEMVKGVGEIDLNLSAPVRGGAGEHRLRFENRHQKAVAAYLVECYAPDDPDLRVVAQNRSVEQERYELRYRQSGSRPILGRTLAFRSSSTRP